MTNGKVFTILGNSFSITSHPFYPCQLLPICFKTKRGVVELCQNDFIEDISTDSLWAKYQPLSPSKEILKKYKISAKLFNEIAKEMADLLTTPCESCGECTSH